MDSITLENCKFLPIIDSFSKYAQVYKLYSAQGIEVTNHLIKYFTHHCIPKQIISDNGTVLNSYIRKLMKIYKEEKQSLVRLMKIANNSQKFHFFFLKNQQKPSTTRNKLKDETITKINPI